MPSRNFLTTAELAAELGDPNLGVIDASWHLPNTGRTGAAEFRMKHIPGAVFFDIDLIADHDQDRVVAYLTDGTQQDLAYSGLAGPNALAVG